MSKSSSYMSDKQPATTSSSLREQIINIVKRQSAPLTYDSMFPEAQEEVDAILSAISQYVDAVRPEDKEQSIFRTEDDNLMCRTCSGDVFGGICDCYDYNQALADYHAKLQEGLK